MIKRYLCVLLSLLCLLLCGCSSANDFGISFSPDGENKVEYIHVFGDEQIVYTVGGVVSLEIDGQEKLLEAALNDGDVKMEDVVESIIEDGKDGDVKTQSYPDGSIEYSYGGFTVVCLNTYVGSQDIYFVPQGMGYYDIVH